MTNLPTITGFSQTKLKKPEGEGFEKIDTRVFIVHFADGYEAHFMRFLPHLPTDFFLKYCGKVQFGFMEGKVNFILPGKRIRWAAAYWRAAHMRLSHEFNPDMSAEEQARWRVVVYVNFPVIQRLESDLVSFTSKLKLILYWLQVLFKHRK